MTHQVEDGVDNLMVRHLSDFDEADEDGELDVVCSHHPDDVLGPLDLGDGGARGLGHAPLSA